MKYLKSIFPDIISLSKKESNLSTKRYGDLRLLNHTILQSWAVLGVLAYNRMWSEVTIHFLILGVLCFGRGLLAKDNFLNTVNKWTKKK
jgi:hypothetical protein